MMSSRVRPMLNCTIQFDCLEFTGMEDDVITVVDGTDAYYGEKLVLMPWF